MSSLKNTQVTCVVCGKEQTVTVILATNTFGSMDLDTRPPQMKRATLPHEIHICDKCGFASRNLNKVNTSLNLELLESKDYQSIHSNKDFNQTAKAFLLNAFLEKSAVNFKSAGISYLSAAWTFDDNCQKEHAIEARRQAIACMTQYIENSADVGIAMVIVDMQRRIGEFEKATESARELLDVTKDEFALKVLKLQIKLCEAKDDKCHTVGEV